jgi:TPR repeat protein
VRGAVLASILSLVALTACGSAQPPVATSAPVAKAKPRKPAAPTPPEKTDEQKCADGDGASCYSVAISIEMDKKDFDGARPFYEKACTLNDGDGCGNLARYERDELRRKILTEKACDEGNGTSCYELGETAHDDGDETNALRYLKRACDAGDIVSSGRACDLMKRITGN